MPISCDPSSLAAESACYCFDEQTQRAIKIYLLEQVAQTGLTPNQLAANAKCYCMDEATQAAVTTYLLCQLVNV